MQALPPELQQLRELILRNLPEGFEEIFSNGMFHYVVPHTLYHRGYHVKPTDPLPFITIATQKTGVVLYHFGIYSDTALLAWFSEEYPKHNVGKLDIGKSCIRLKKGIPSQLIAELIQKMSVTEWITLYEKTLKK